jgi:hypothetical protein
MASRVLVSATLAAPSLPTPLVVEETRDVGAPPPAEPIDDGPFSHG